VKELTSHGSDGTKTDHAKGSGGHKRGQKDAGSSTSSTKGQRDEN
jgi:hypothetical protein